MITQVFLVNFTCDGCARDPYFYVPAETQSYVIKLAHYHGIVDIKLCNVYQIVCIFVYLFIVDIYVYFLSAYVCVLIKHSVFTYMHACIYVLACVYVCTYLCVGVCMFMFMYQWYTIQVYLVYTYTCLSV